MVRNGEVLGPIGKLCGRAVLTFADMIRASAGGTVFASARMTAPGFALATKFSFDNKIAASTISK